MQLANFLIDYYVPQSPGVLKPPTNTDFFLTTYGGTDLLAMTLNEVDFLRQIHFSALGSSSSFIAFEATTVFTQRQFS